MTSPNAKLSAGDVAAIEEIKQPKTRYRSCVDQKGWPRYASVFTPDARLDEREFAVATYPSGCPTRGGI